VSKTTKPVPVELPPTLHPDHPDYGRERYTVRQAAAYLDVSRATVWREASARRIAHRRLPARGAGAPAQGCQMRFAQRDLDAYRQMTRVEVRRPPKPPMKRRAAAGTAQPLSDLKLPEKRRFM
jgi:Helix-turn-helix domain